MAERTKGNTLRFGVEVTETARELGSEWAPGASGVIWAPGVDVAEIAEKDPEPFFVEMTILREGRGNGKPAPKRYLGSSVEDTAKLAPGLQLYLGHQNPAERGREYRIPQGKVIASRVDTEKDAAGKTVKVARVKAYISKAAKTLRTHLDEGMAGPVSIDGRAVLRGAGDDVEVPHMLSLRCIDFCNPGTEGVKGAGVDRIVSEMDDHDDEDEPQENPMTTPARLTRDGLMAEYGAEIREMQREEADKAKAPLEAQVTEMKAKLAKAEETLAERDATIKTLTDEKGELEARVTEMTTERDEAKKTATLTVLGSYRDEVVSEMGVIDSAAKRIAGAVELTLVDGDDAELTKSKAALKTALTKAHDDVAEMAKDAGGTIKKKDAAKTGVQAADVTETTRSNGDDKLAGDDRKKALGAIFPALAKQTQDA